MPTYCKEALCPLRSQSSSPTWARSRENSSTPTWYRWASRGNKSARRKPRGKCGNKFGLEVALEALRECYGKREATMDELFRAAKICRVARVMQPYLESLA